MRRIVPLAACALLLALAPGAHAETLDQSHARQILQKTDGGFRFFTIDPRGDLVHTLSGLACRQRIRDSETVIITVQDRAEGKDVSCSYIVGTFGRFTVVATRMPPGMTADDLMPLAQSALAQEVTDPRPQTPPAAFRVTDEALGLDISPLAATYNTIHQGRYFTSTVWLAVVDGWAVKLYGSYITPERARGEALAREVFTWAATSVKAAPGS